MNRTFAAFFSVALFCALSSQAFAHAFHVSVAEAEVNHRSNRIEVALRVHPSDLERALEQMNRSSRRSYRRIQLEKEPKIDELILQYLQSSIQLTETKTTPKTDTKDKKAAKVKPAKPGKLVWVGKEVDVKWAWLYFEIPIPKQGLDNATLSNKVFIELLEDQVNTVILKDGKRKQTLSFDKSHGSRKVVLPKVAKAAAKNATPTNSPQETR